MKFKFTIVFLCFCLTKIPHVSGQKYHLPNGINDSIAIVNGDTVIIKRLKEVIFFPLLNKNEIKDMKRYLYLKRKVHKVYDYAQMASDSLMIIQGRLNKLKKKRKKRKEIKKVQRFIERELKPKLKKTLTNRWANIIEAYQSGNRCYRLSIIKSIQKWLVCFLVELKG